MDRLPFRGPARISFEQWLLNADSLCKYRSGKSIHSLNYALLKAYQSGLSVPAAVHEALAKARLEENETEWEFDEPGSAGKRGEAEDQESD